NAMTGSKSRGRPRIARITEALLALTQTTTYSSALAGTGSDRLTRTGYTEAFPQNDLPWADGHWSAFWAYYMGGREHGPGNFWKPTADAGFEYVIPFRWMHSATIAGPAKADIDAEVLVYPSAITTIVWVR